MLCAKLDMPSALKFQSILFKCCFDKKKCPFTNIIVSLWWWRLEQLTMFWNSSPGLMVLRSIQAATNQKRSYSVFLWDKGYNEFWLFLIPRVSCSMPIAVSASGVSNFDICMRQDEELAWSLPLLREFSDALQCWIILQWNFALKHVPESVLLRDI